MIQKTIERIERKGIHDMILDFCFKLQKNDDLQ